MTDKKSSLGGYPVDRLGNILGPEKYDSDNLPTMEQVRRSHSPEYNKWFDDRLAEARADRQKRERGWALAKRRHPFWYH
jgi:hypothetical protein